ncbi:DUF401 family protein [Patescibacteria group bacterium]|nr:DUF401 family protein [Patescibacteria group bacterium]
MDKFDAKLNIIFSVIVIIAIATMFYITEEPLALIWNKFILKTQNVELLALFTGVLFVANIYRQTGNATDNLLYWTKFLKNGKLSLIFTSLFLGLMPVKGRTILSAPIIAQIAQKNNLDNFSASMVNYLSSHIYYLIFPLSTSLMFVIIIMKFNYFNFIFFLMPGVLFLAMMVWYFASRSNISSNFSIETKSSFKEAARFVLPIVVLLISLGLSELYKIQYSILIGTVIFVALSVVLLKPSRSQIKAAYKSIDKYLIFILFLILLLSAFTSNSPLIKNYFSGIIAGSYSIPILIVIGYLIGFTIGSSSTMVSAIFPLLAPILTGNPLAYQIAAIVYASEYAGYIASPAHPCCHYAASFFNVPYIKVWWKISIYAAIASALNIIFALFFINAWN